MQRQKNGDAARIEILEDVVLLEEVVRRRKCGSCEVRGILDENRAPGLIGVMIEFAAEHVDVLRPFVPRVRRAVHADERSAVGDPIEQRVA